MPANAGRSACATCPTVTPSEPASAAIELHVEFGLLAARGQADVDRAGHLASRAPSRRSATLLQLAPHPGRATCS